MRHVAGRLGTIVLLFLVFVALGSCGKSSSSGAAARAPSSSGAQGQRREVVVPVRAVPIERGDLVAARDAAGSVVPAVQSSVAAQVGGFVSTVFRQTGDWVEAGEIVVQLDESQLKLARATASAAYESARINLEVGQESANAAGPKLELQLRSAEASLASAQKFYDSQNALFGLGGITASQLDTASSQLALAQANVEGARAALEQNRKAEGQDIAKLKLALEQTGNQLAQAELNLKNAAIRAPFAGQISSLSAAPGMYLGQNGTAFVLVSRSRRLSFSVAPGDAPALVEGTRVEFSYGGMSYRFRVSRQPSAPVGGLVPLLAEPLDAFDPPYGAVGTVRYSTLLARGILIPVAALDGSQAGAFVFAVTEDRAEQRSVRVIAEYEDRAVVEGLEPGALVVLDPPPGLLPGSTVELREAGGNGPRPSQEGGNPSVPRQGAAGGQNGAGAGAGTGAGSQGGRRASTSGGTSPGSGSGQP